MPLIYNEAFSYATGAGTTNIEMPLMDYSRFDWLRLEIKFTTMNTDAGDTMDVRLQMTSDRVQWHTRMRSPQFLGSGDPDVAGPEYWVMVVRQTATLSADEESYEPSGSESATEIVANRVLNGPFPGKYRDTTELKWRPNVRIQAVVADAGGADTSFIGTYWLWGGGNVNRY